MSDVAARAATMAGGSLKTAERLSGGSLSEVLRLHLADGRTFVAKHATTARAEAEMLQAIAATGASTPSVIAVADDLLIMTDLHADGPLRGDAWTKLAAVMAHLHRPRVAAYGWGHDHAFGDVAIANTPMDAWTQFWGEHRLLCHCPHVDGALARRLERLAARLHNRLPSQPDPALLHGDLWGGNVLVGDGGVHLIDPACYVGHREVDVAMLTLFDRPPDSFFVTLGLDAGWRERQPIYRLWPLLVHLRLFGGAYRASVDDALRQAGF